MPTLSFSRMPTVVVGWGGAVVVGRTATIVPPVDAVVVGVAATVVDVGASVASAPAWGSSLVGVGLPAALTVLSCWPVRAATATPPRRTSALAATAARA